MNELTTTTQQLPETIEDLTQFVLVGKAKLQAYMLKLQTVNKLSIAQEIRDQTLAEAQEISSAVIAAEQRIGEILLSIPKATGNQYTNANSERAEKAKSEVASEMGYSRHDVSDYQRMAQNPEIVQMVINNALANGEVVTKSQVMKEIKAATAEKDKTIEILKSTPQSTREKFEKNRADRLQAELEELKNRKPETVEVAPEDYEAAKFEAEANRKKMELYLAECERLERKYEKKCDEALKLQDELHELKSASMEGLENSNLSENIFYFCAICNNFISNVGGLVWLTERISDMPQKEKEMYLKAARAFNDWSTVFKSNLERSLDAAEKRTDAGVPLLPD